MNITEFNPVAEPIDKSNWSDGEWQTEADYECFLTKSGYYGIVWRMKHSGNLNGYVEVPKTHALHGYSYSTRIAMTKEISEAPVNIDKTSVIALVCNSFKDDDLISLDCAVEVHGGLTFSSDFKDLDAWLFGFDTAHCDDLSPHPSRIRWSTGRYRNWEYVKQEVENLATQLKQLESVQIPAIEQKREG